MLISAFFSGDGEGKLAAKSFRRFDRKKNNIESRQRIQQEHSFALRLSELLLTCVQHLMDTQWREMLTVYFCACASEI
jgi:hypothetical protein